MFLVSENVANFGFGLYKKINFDLDQKTFGISPYHSFI